MDKNIPRNGKDSTRAERKAKKRKLENAVPALPNDYDHTLGKEDSMPVLDRGKKSSKKRKRDEDNTRCDFTSNKAVIAAHEKDNKSKELIRGSKTKPKEKNIIAEEGELVASHSGSSVLDEPIHRPRREKILVDKSKDSPRIKGTKRKIEIDHEVTEKIDSKAPRFIVFIGNLPFTATEESIRKHFDAVHPKSIRHLTKKDEPTKSRGCAFVEFEGYDHMKSCLKSFHHSVFVDGISAPRKINVELTAGGGGNKKNRHAKIHEKNQKLNEERVRKMQEEDKAKLVKKNLASDYSTVHPSRRARVPDTS